MKNSSEDILEVLTARANGMLPSAVYKAIFEAASLAPGPNFVEVGTGHGASAIALALGAKLAGVNAHVHTIDCLGGRFSSRSRFGSVESNKNIIFRNFEEAGVQDCITLQVGTAEEFAGSAECPSQIHLLLLDADGRIDRDLLCFGDAISHNAIIIIDDVDDNVYVGQDSSGAHYIDLKHRITHLLLGMLASKGYLNVERQIESTVFCRYGAHTISKPDLELLALGVYRELIFSPISDPELQRHFPRSDATRRSPSAFALAAVQALGQTLRRRSG